MKRIPTLIILSIFLVIVNADRSSAATKKKKLFINDLTAGSGVSKRLTKKARDYMSLAVFENFKNRYQLVTDDDIKVMYKKASAVMAAGCDAQACVTQIADAINADEIIYGALERDGGKLRIAMQNLLRDKETLSVSKKSIVNMKFYESQLEWFCKEIAKKLVNSDYSIDPDKAPAVVSGRFEVGKIDIKEVKGLDIGIMKFTSSDETASKMLALLKNYVEKGDVLYKGKEYVDAREQYRTVVSKINKLREESRQKISQFSDSVFERISATYSAEFKNDIENVDDWLRSEGDLDEDILRDGEQRYKQILDRFNKIPRRESAVLFLLRIH